MSSAFYVFPLHKLGDDGLEWLATLDFVHGVPGSAPAGQALPTVSDVVDVLRTNGCHGYACSTVDASGSWLPAVGDLDVGEVMLHGDEPLDQGTSVEAVSFRRPDPAAVLRVACGLAPVAGPLVVHDEGDSAFVVDPGQRFEDLVGAWPWEIPLDGGTDHGCVG